MPPSPPGGHKDTAVTKSHANPPHAEAEARLSRGHNALKGCGSKLTTPAHPKARVWALDQPIASLILHDCFRMIGL